jgi:isoamylase
MGEGTGSMHPARGALSPLGEKTWNSADWPLGARALPDGSCTFAVRAPEAERLLLELYDESFGADASRDYWMARCPDGAWRARIAGLGAGAAYAFRAWGPNWPFDAAWRRGDSSAGFLADVDDRGRRFNPNKALLDPYAREVSHEKICPAAIAGGYDGRAYGSGGADVSPSQAHRGALACRAVDTGRISPKALVVADGESFGEKPRLAPEEAIVYEAQVRGLTAHPSASRLRACLAPFPEFSSARDVPEELRGTYAGAAFMAPYVKALGYTAIELLPVHETAAGPCPTGRPGGNFWGYMTACFFAPDRRYAADKRPGGPTREFKAMVRAFHEEGIEVYLDVVYNHTAEGGLWDSTGASAEILSYRGLDNPGYYALVPGNPRAYWESTGCGNNLDAGSPAVRGLILDSLAYWLDEMGADGFRFDLAPVLGRVQAAGYGFNPRADILVQIADLAASRGAEVIAEAWDCSEGGYQVGNFPDRWAEWNGRYRDSVRRFMKFSLGGNLSPADALHGDWLHFADQGGPGRSINFVDAHDGFTLADLVSYDRKRNDGDWPFGPSDGGSDSNESWDSSWVPPAADCPDSRAFRRQRWRNFVAFLMLSRGVPMTVYGDELLRTQNGNNNPYNIDSAATWSNYDSIATDSPQAVPTGSAGEPYHDNFGPDALATGRSACFAFMAYMARLRRGSPALRQGGYEMGIAYSHPDGSVGFEGKEDLAFRARVDGSSVGDRDYLLLVNLSCDRVRFAVEEPDAGTCWKRLADTARWAERWDNCWRLEEATEIEGDYEAAACSIVVLAAS